MPRLPHRISTPIDGLSWAAGQPAHCQSPLSPSSCVPIAHPTTGLVTLGTARMCSGHAGGHLSRMVSLLGMGSPFPPGEGDRDKGHQWRVSGPTVCKGPWWAGESPAPGEEGWLLACVVMVGAEQECSQLPSQLQHPSCLRPCIPQERGRAGSPGPAHSWARGTALAQCPGMCSLLAPGTAHCHEEKIQIKQLAGIGSSPLPSQSKTKIGFQQPQNLSQPRITGKKLREVSRGLCPARLHPPQVTQAM